MIRDIPPAAVVPCPLWRRLLALVYDLLIVIAIVMVVGLLCQMATGGRLIATGAHIDIAWWYRPLQGVAVSAYFIASWMRGGQTIGMKPWHIAVVDRAGKLVTLQRALLRVLVAAVPLSLTALAPVVGLRASLWAVLACWVLWFAPALFDPRRRAIHDLIAGTQVCRR